MNSFGRIFRVHIFGESHGESVGIVIDGCPAGLALSRRRSFTGPGKKKRRQTKRNNTQAGSRLSFF